jgi:cyanophycinase
VTSLHLLGGGWDPASSKALYGAFLDRAGAFPVVACIVLDEGDGQSQFARWSNVLRRTASCEPVPVLVPLGGALPALPDADALLVCGGLTPAYADALAPAAPRIRNWLTHGDRPYAGFSAGAAVAATRAVVGGYRDGGVAVCPEDAAEDLDEVTTVDGLGLVPWIVDVHCAQWGTLPRLIAAVARTPGGRGLAIDENTAVHSDGDGAVVAGTGAVRQVLNSKEGVTVTTLRPGSRLSLS